MRPMRRPLLLVACVLVAGCANPRVQENMAQAMIDFGNELAGMRQDISALQGTVDSLRQLMAKQDTVIDHLATLAGVPVPKR